MASYEFTGTVMQVGDVQTFSSGFFKREIVVTSEGDRYPQNVPFEFLKDRSKLLDGIAAGERVTISFDINAREYNGRRFISLNGWKIKRADASNGGSPMDEAPPPATFDGGSLSDSPDNLSDDMPF